MGGEYDPHDPHAGHGARFSFGSGTRAIRLPPTHTPPPGTYDVKSSLGEGHRGFTQRGKPKPLPERGNESPGPGAYLPSMKFFEHGARVSFGNAARGELIDVSQER